MNIGILADSCCDLTPAMRRLLGVGNASLSINVGALSFRDDETLEQKRLLAAMKASKTPPHTACPSPQEYAALMGQYDVCFVITLSSRLSGSYGAACAGRDLLAENGGKTQVYVLDSKSAAAGQTLMALELRQMINGGLAVEEMVRRMDAFVKRMRTLFVLEDLANLVKNGRISKTAGLLGGALGIRPVMGDDGDGNIQLVEKIRGTQNAMRRLVAIVAEDLAKERKGSRTLAISFCNCADRALALKKELLNACPALREIVLSPTGGISTVYASDGGVVLAY